VRIDRRGTLITFLSALGLLGPTSIGLFLSGVPTVFSPFPALTVIPALTLAQWHLEYAAVLIPTLLFLLWNLRKGTYPKGLICFLSYLQH